jgi:uncharacterized protein (TIGR00730 family)
MRLCVFLGSSSGIVPSYGEAAFGFGALLARRGIGLVYGGGSIGLMGLVADGARSEGGEVIGVIPEALRAREQDHSDLTELHVTRTMHERKAMMAEMSDGFVALPGGIGTFEELFEVWTWSQLGYHAKPCALLNINGFYDAMRSFIDHVVAEGFLKPAHRDMLQLHEDPDVLLNAMFPNNPEAQRPWIGRADL